MGAAVSYGTETHTDKYEIEITTQTVLIRAFAIDPSDNTTVVQEITGLNGYNTYWKSTKSSGTNGTLIFETKDGSLREIGSGDNPVFFAYISKAYTAGGVNDNVYYVTETSPSIDYTGDTVLDVFTNFTTVNNFTMTFNSGAGGGDPRIQPYINPYKEPLVLPCDDKLYNYFSYHSNDSDEIITVNAQMWYLSFDRIVLTEELRRDLIYLKKPQLKTQEKYDAYPIAHENITKYPLNYEDLTENDESFMKIVKINYVKNGVTINMTIDMESLEVLENENYENIKIFDKVRYVKPNMVYGKKKFDRINTDSYMKRIILYSEKFGKIDFEFIRDTNRLNHRNNIIINFQKNKRKNELIKLPVNGALIHPNRLYTVPKLTTTDFNEFIKEPIPILLSEYSKKNGRRLKLRRFAIRKMVREHDFHLLDHK